MQPLCNGSKSFVDVDLENMKHFVAQPLNSYWYTTAPLCALLFKTINLKQTCDCNWRL